MRSMKLPSHALKRACLGCAESKEACAERTFSPVPPYQLLEGVDADIVRVHVLDRDIALLEISLIDLVRMPGSS
jgi:hypothetical protein